MRARRSVRAEAKARFAVIGSGNWGSTIAKLIADNTAGAEARRAFPHAVEAEVRMWVRDERLPSGESLVDAINSTHINEKYLPGIRLPDNVVACASLAEAAEGATHFAIVVPHQYVLGVCDELKPHVNTAAASAVSLTKGLPPIPPLGQPPLLSAAIGNHLGIDCGVCAGANISGQVAKEEFSEATLALPNGASNPLAAGWRAAFHHHDYFHVTVTDDVSGVELFSALKNVVAVGAGIVDGLGLGSNTKAAIIRVGLREMVAFARALDPSVRVETAFESCGVADLITTCIAGRNRAVGEAYAKADGTKTFEELELELLGGQKLQGVLTAAEAAEAIEARGLGAAAGGFPLFRTIDAICKGRLPPAAIVRYEDAAW